MFVRWKETKGRKEKEMRVKGKDMEGRIGWMEREEEEEGEKGGRGRRER